MNLSDVKKITTQKVRNKRFFFFDDGGQTRIYDEYSLFYGTWLYDKNFVEEYKKIGEEIRIYFQTKLEPAR